jgi:hypothetical protein
VSKLSTAARRLLVGRPFRSDRLSHILLPKRIALPVFASDVLSSVAYACRPCARRPTRAPRPDAQTRDLVHRWQDSDIAVPLKVIASTYREITRPILDYVKPVSKDSPRTVVTVFIPEYVVGHWWGQVLHNQSALRLKAFQPHAAPGDARRGIFD